MATPPAVPAQYAADVDAAAKALGISAGIVAAQIDDESSWNPNAVSPAGAQGIAQFEPGTWKEYGHGSPFDPTAAFAAYTAYMSELIRHYKGNLRDALAAYNAGGANLAAGYGYADKILAQADAANAQAQANSPDQGGLFGQLLQLPDQVTNFFTALEKPVQGLAWFINPTNWARILAGGLGAVLLIAGLVAIGLAV